MSNLFLFGAGASAHSGACWPNLPPDGSRLFAALAEAGTAKLLARRYGELFRSNFERGMAAVRRDADESTTPLIRQMGAYLSVFEPSLGNSYVTLLKAITERMVSFQIATTNYDLLIERALGLLGRRSVYGLPPMVFREPPGDTVLKIHGSCNFLPDIGNNTFSGVIFKNNRVNFSGPVRVVNTPDALRRYYLNDDSLAPAMALYSEGKEVLFCPDFVQQQQRAFSELVSRARNIFVIGLRVNEQDSHIWGGIATSTANLWYVAPEADIFAEWVARYRRANARHLAPTFESAVSKIPPLCA